MRRILVGLMISLALFDSAAARATPSPDPLDSFGGAFNPSGQSALSYCAPDFDTPETGTITVPAAYADPGAGDLSLFARYYKPGCGELPAAGVPTILVVSPYFNGFFRGASGDPVFDRRGKEFVDRYAPRGYAVVLADIRGTGYSGGCFEMDGVNQAKDYKKVVDWIRAQTWSNGRVGAYGGSFDAEAIHAGLAVQAGVALDSVVSVAGPSGLYEIAYFDGVPRRTRGTEDAAAYLQYSHDPPQDPEKFRPVLDRTGCQVSTMQAASDTSGDMTPWYQEREFRTGIANVTQSVLHIQGFEDPSVYPSNIPGWFDQLPGFKRALWWQGGHTKPCGSEPGFYDGAYERCYAEHALGRGDFFPMLDAWFDYTLKGLATGVPGWPAVQVQDENNLWRTAPSFAGLGTATSYPLGTNGVLGTASTGNVDYTENTSASWTTAALGAPLHLSGQAKLDAWIKLSDPSELVTFDDAHFMLEVHEVGVDALGLETTRTLTRGYLSARHRSSLSAPSAVPAGALLKYAIRTMPFDRWVDAGKRIRLVLRGSDPEMLPAGNAYMARVSLSGSALSLPVVANHVCLQVGQLENPTKVPDACVQAARTCRDLGNCAFPSGRFELGAVHTCALDGNGGVECAGRNTNGQLGDGTTTSSTTPVTVASIKNAVEVTGGEGHTCARLSTGQLACWGNNDRGQLGDGTTTSSTTPVTVAGITNALEVTAGGWHTCARLSTGELRCWGNNDRGQLGDGTTTSRPVAIAVDITNAVEVTAGGWHTCARLSTGELRCWGDNTNGQLGDGTTTSSTTPVAVAGITNALEVTAGGWHTCARLSTGQLRCWGNNGSGQLGDGTTNDRSTPVTPLFGSGRSSRGKPPAPVRMP
ncbi:MAG TPA: CocE/NonD family hydrolase [Acidimicrobiales bacterium]|nr:CocE/NonD family hydrolase [Acidimicrobiales bacterium]